ncbi:IS1380 family transposase [Stieleria sp.]|uniref:IS1380 family transposase n=1 Tax=Stieleria sp. TaxID=2795976 RepID=UPI0035679C1D
MTKRKRNRPALKRLRRQAVEVDFDGGTLTSDGGLLLLREVDNKLNLIKRIDQAIRDPRDPFHITHSQAEILTSRIFAIAAGYEDVNDQQQLRDDPAFQVAAGRTPRINGSFDDDEDPTLASPSTHCRFENRISEKELFELNKVLVDTFLDSFNVPPDEITLDYDATDDRVHGNQDKKAFNAYYDSYCFQPLYVFCDDQLVVAHLRPANRGDAHHARGITKLLVARIRQRWAHVKITLRGDGGFAVERLMRWCDKNDVHYVFGLPKNSVLVDEIACEMTRARILQSHLGGKQACFKWFRYRTRRTWDRHRWVVGKAEYTGKGPNPRFVVTNRFSSDGIVDTTYHRPMVDGKRQPLQVETPGTWCSAPCDPEKFYRERYCMRGEMENRIKEQQLCLFADRTSCSRFAANRFRLMLSSFAYVLLDGLRRLGLSATKHSRLRVDTIRLRLLKIAARVRVTCRRVVFHLCSHCPWEPLFNQVLARLCRSD